MIGFVEESEKITTARTLRRAAEKFVGSRLLGGFAADDDPEWEKLAAAASAYAEARRPKRKKKT